MRYDPARWICQCKPSLCHGTFYVYGEARPCPLWPKCKGNKNQLEYLYHQQHPNQRKLTLAEPDRYMAHAKRALDLRRAFVPDDVRRLNKASYERNKAKYSAISARKYREAHPPGEKRKGPEIPLPPCGYACEEEDGVCPYDDECRYQDWEGQQLAALEEAKKREQQERHNARRRERIATDPEFAERIRESKRKAKRKARADPVKREAMNAAQRERRANETPEQRAVRLAKKKAYRQRKKEGAAHDL